MVHNHGAARVAAADPDVEEPGVAGHLLVEKRLDSHEVPVDLEGDLLDVRIQNPSNKIEIQFHFISHRHAAGVVHVTTRCNCTHIAESPSL